MKCLLDGDLLLDFLYCLHGDADLLLAFPETEEKQEEGNDSPYTHDLDPCGLRVAEELNQRQRGGDGENLAEWGERHARDREHVTLL